MRGRVPPAPGARVAGLPGYDEVQASGEAPTAPAAPPRAVDRLAWFVLPGMGALMQGEFSLAARTFLTAALAWTLLLVPGPGARLAFGDAGGLPWSVAQGVVAALTLLGVLTVHAGAGRVAGALYTWNHSRNHPQNARTRRDLDAQQSRWSAAATRMLSLAAGAALLLALLRLPGWALAAQNFGFLLIGPLRAPDNSPEWWRLSGLGLMMLGVATGAAGLGTGAHLAALRRLPLLPAALALIGVGTVLIWPVVAGQQLLGGLGLSVALAVWSLLLAGLVAPLLAAMRTSAWPVPRLMATAFIDLSRAVPLLVWVFGAYLLLPYALGQGTGMIAVILALSGFTGAYFAEALRAGLEDLPRGQAEAARSLGLSGTQTLRLITLPQATRRMLPTLTAQAVTLFKDTSLVSVVGVIDLTSAARSVANRSPDSATALYVSAALLYFALGWLLSKLAGRGQGAP